MAFVKYIVSDTAVVTNNYKVPAVESSNDYL